jgi:hypothetical protein
MMRDTGLYLYMTVRVGSSRIEGVLADFAFRRGVISGENFSQVLIFAI